VSGAQGGTRIPVFDIRIESEDAEAFAGVLRSGSLSMGARTEAFEREFAEHLGAAHVVALSSCTAALHLACVAAGVGEGDEVIVPSQTFVATVNAVLYSGATPVFADIVGPGDLNIDPDAVEAAITERTRAVLPVHYAGYPVAIERISALCEERGLALIEDSAHAPSATAAGRMLGTFGLAGCFSFFSNKILSCGEGGALATDDAEVAERGRRLRSEGMTEAPVERDGGVASEYDVAEAGFNYRLDEPRSALLSSRLRRLDAEVERRRELVLRYRELLGGIEGVSLPWEDADVASSSCYLMAVIIEGGRRNEVRRALRDRHGVQTTVFPAVHEFEVYRRRFPGLSLPHTEYVAASMFSLPLFSHMSEETQDQVAAALRDSLRQ
jgi:dTDP-4-amino-4,6-dideoxygalactose transaminase